MLLRLPKDVRAAPITSRVVINAFLGFGGCCCKGRCIFCMADGVSLSDVLQLWCWYLQHEKVRGQHNLVEVAIIFLKICVKVGNGNKTVPFSFSQSYNIAKMNVKYAPESQVQVRWLITISISVNYNIFNTFLWQTGQDIAPAGHCLCRVGLPEVPGESSERCQLSQQGWNHWDVGIYSSKNCSKATLHVCS